MTSCISKKKMVYFQGKGDSKTEGAKNYTPVLKSDDLLSILVTAFDAEAVRPFNLPLASMSTTQYGGYSTGTPSQPGFLVDANGNIDFPVIGAVHLGGMDRLAATALLKEKLSAYVSNPIVIIRILNFKVTVLGEVRNPGTFTIPNERITLPEAIGIAGDLNITGVRNNVLVVRDVDGKKTETRVDLTSKELFSSPVYYLNQNDMIYVEPNRAKINSSVINPANAGIIISAVSLIITVLALITR
ncbi:MAG: polysaccharide biosynthesis/export family protein [Bacteroidia bacterium]